MPIWSSCRSGTRAPEMSRTDPGYPARTWRRSSSVEPGRGLTVGNSHTVLRGGRRAAVRVALEVVLIFGLGFPERTALADLGHDLAGPVARGVDVPDRLLRHRALLLTRAKDLRAVAGTRRDLRQGRPGGSGHR